MEEGVQRRDRDRSAERKAGEGDTALGSRRVSMLVERCRQRMLREGRMKAGPPLRCLGQRQLTEGMKQGTGPKTYLDISGSELPRR